MPKLYVMNICLFIFLFHFASNKERFFLIFSDNEKYEFTLNHTSEGGKSFYKQLNKNKNISITFTYYYNDDGHALQGGFSLEDLKEKESQSGEVQKGEIVYSQSCLFNKFLQLIQAFLMPKIWNMKE